MARFEVQWLVSVSDHTLPQGALAVALSVVFALFSDRCESCVDLLFVRGAGNCPECGTPLRKSNFRVQLFEDPAVDKEVEIRKKVLKM